MFYICGTTHHIIMINLQTLIGFLAIISTSYSTISICGSSKNNETGRCVGLRNTRTDASNCRCSLRLTKVSGTDNVTFDEQMYPGGCQYELELLVTKSTQKQMYSCTEYNSKIFYHLKQNDEIQIKLVTGSNSLGGFTFNFSICVGKSGSELTLICNQDKSTTTEPITAPVTAPTASVTTPVTAPTTNTSTLLSNQPHEAIPVAAIIGGSVGGFVFITLDIVIIICLVKRKRKHQKQNDNSPKEYQETNETPIVTNDSYVSIDSVMMSEVRDITDNEVDTASDNNQSLVEYAVINKKQAMKASRNDNDIKHTYENTKTPFKIGPKGDVYTVVVKS